VIVTYACHGVFPVIGAILSGILEENSVSERDECILDPEPEIYAFRIRPIIGV
jgi:hypothetical protein